jgi:hypothetical protein
MGVRGFPHHNKGGVMAESTLNNAQKAHVLNLRATGLGGRAIATSIGVPYGRVRRFLEAQHPQTETPTGLAPGKATFRALVWDLECTNLKSDLGLLLCAAFLDLGDGSVVSRTIDDFGPREGGEHGLVLWVKSMVEAGDALIGHNATGFDKNFVNGVLARYDETPLPRRYHIDTYQVARHGWTGLPSSYSLRNLTNFFHLAELKESLDKDEWRCALADPEAMRALRLHCEADVRTCALLWQRLKPAFFSWRGR